MTKTSKRLDEHQFVIVMPTVLPLYLHYKLILGGVAIPGTKGEAVLPLNSLDILPALPILRVCAQEMERGWLSVEFIQKGFVVQQMQVPPGGWHLAESEKPPRRNRGVSMEDSTERPITRVTEWQICRPNMGMARPEQGISVDSGTAPTLISQTALSAAQTACEKLTRGDWSPPRRCNTNWKDLLIQPIPNGSVGRSQQSWRLRWSPTVWQGWLRSTTPF